ncbi:Transcription initiation protein spt3 [Quaeritorhiza haematococci]|nr:Transcription initiation protein spt3 [Quaeritorhiza haematococci]
MASKQDANKYKYQSEIQQMMFVFGEVAEPLEETTQLVEEITRAQIIEILIQAVQQAQKRGSRYLSAEDLIFLIRHDRQKVNRMRMFLSWKDVRKNVKDRDGGAGAADAEELMEEGGASGDKPMKVKKMKVKFSWDLFNALGSVLSDEEEEEDDEEDREAYEDQIHRLRLADEVTRTMTKDEYIYYSECRQASFTFKKTKRFRDWCQMQQYYDNKANSDVIDILGFLGYEIVSRLTEYGLMVKKEWEDKEKEERAKEDRRNAGLEDENYLFGKSNDEQTPMQPIHIQEGFRRLQKTSHPLHNFKGGLVRTMLSLI